MVDGLVDGVSVGFGIGFSETFVAEGAEQVVDALFERVGRLWSDGHIVLRVRCLAWHV